MSARFWTISALLMLKSVSAYAQSADMPVGTWYCVMNSAPATIQTNVRLSPDGSVVSDGLIILNGTSGNFSYRQAPGRWSIGPNGDGQSMVRIQIFPQGRPVFSLFVIPRDQNNMYNFFPAQDAQVETACQRTG